MNTANEERSEPTMSIRTWLMLIGSIAILSIIGVCVYLALPTIRILAPALAITIVVTLIVAIPGSVIGAAFWLYHAAQNKRIQARKFAANANNVYPAYLDLERGVFIQAINGELPQVVPEHYAPSIQHHNDVNQLAKLLEYAQSTRVQEIAAPADRIQRPSQDYLLSQLPHNKFLVSPGVQSTTGEVVVVDLLKVPHLKIIGSSGFGKSCLAAAILDQATMLNDTKHMQLALLDLEHKTSRLFEDRPHVAELQDGRRRVTMVATNADDVATHLSILKKELDRRAAMDERELHRNPVLLMYVEEMLSLQYEIVDPKLLAKMFAALTILAVRGRKYGMFLLACMQTDYSTDDLKVSQKQFRYRAAAAIDVPAARAAGFMNTDLIKDNFQHGTPGQFVVEYPSFSNIVLAPEYDVRTHLNQKEGIEDGFSGDFGAFTIESTSHVQPVHSEFTTDVQTSENDATNAWEAKVEQVRELLAKEWGKIKIIEHVWRPVKAGSNKPYKTACAEYDQIVEQLTAEE